MAKRIILMVLLLPMALAFNLDILETNPSPVRAGEYADITVRLISTSPADTERENVKLRVEQTDDVRPIAGQEFVFNRLKGGDEITRTFRVFFSEDLGAGNVPVNFQVVDDDYRINLKRDVFVRGALTMPELYIGAIRTTPNELLKDTKSNRIVLTLQNLGDKKADLLNAQVIDLECCIEESFTYSLQDSISSLDSGEEKELTFTFDILETAKDVITPTLRVRYRMEDELSDSFETVTQSIPFEIPLTKAPDMIIAKTEPRGEIQARTQENELEVVVKNIGEEEGKSVRLRLFPDPSYPFDFERTNYFVSSVMEPGENATVIVKFDVLDFANIRSYPVKIELESLVGENRYTQDDELDIEVTGVGTNQARMFRTVFLAIAGVVAVALGIFVIAKRRPKRSKRKA